MRRRDRRPRRRSDPRSRRRRRSPGHRPVRPQPLPACTAPRRSNRRRVPEPDAPAGRVRLDRFERSSTPAMPSRSSTGSISSRKPLERMTRRQPRSRARPTSSWNPGRTEACSSTQVDDLVELAVTGSNSRRSTSWRVRALLVQRLVDLARRPPDRRTSGRSVSSRSCSVMVPSKSTKIVVMRAE